MLKTDSVRRYYPANDVVHGFEHVLRVYSMAERLALAEGADMEIVGAAVLLHDASPEQAEAVDASAVTFTEGEREKHQHASADLAARVLRAEGWMEGRIAAVQHCIRSHRFRDSAEPPRTLEAQVLFDADKLDAIGAIGVARAVAYAAQAGQPAWAQPSEQFLQTGKLAAGEAHTAYHEYVFKLVKLKERMFTATARQIAAERHQVMEEFFSHLAAEVQGKA